MRQRDARAQPFFPKPKLEATAEELEGGEEILAFFHCHQCPKGRYVRVFQTEVQLLLGLSSGWLPAVVTAPWRRSRAGVDQVSQVQVRFHGRFCDPRLGSTDGIEMAVPANMIRRKKGQPVPETLLSLLVVRWWDYTSNQTWSDYAVTNDGMLRDLIDGECGVYPSLAGEFEAFTAFVQSSADLERISARWAREALSGHNAAVWYFLWPVQREDPDLPAGCVNEQSFFSLCQRLERAGLRSGWPHPCSLYRQLCGKLWVPALSLCPEFRVPPTTRVQYADVKSNVKRAALQALERLKQIRGEVWNQPSPPAEDFRGVVKLGYSWQGNDVLPFQGVENLERVLVTLFEQPGSTQLVCLVQEMVPNVVCEHRILCFADAAAGFAAARRERLWLRMKRGGEHPVHQNAVEVRDFALTSANVVTEEEASAAFFGGDDSVREATEAFADQLANRWLLWFGTECADPPPVTRLDFLVSLDQEGSGDVSVWTCEVGECGASLCSVECDARNCAVLNWAIADDPSGRWPQQLPVIARNSGWKS